MRKNVTEEYLETILYLTRNGSLAKTKDIAEVMKIKPPSVTEMLLKLNDEGYIHYEPYVGASLTSKGMEKAIQIERKHQLLEKFLVDNLGVDTSTAHNEACEMEHSISDETMEKLCTYLGHPRLCPDAHTIPRGECCDQAETTEPLSKLREGDSAIIKVVSIDDDSRDFLMSLGFLPDVVITVKKKLPSNSLLVKVKGSEIAIGKDIAKKILVAKVGICH